MVAEATSKDAFEYYARMIPITSKDDWVILKRPKDGILAHFGNFNVSSITTGTIRNYLVKLDDKRPTPLATSTLKKHVIILRKVLRFAREDGMISAIPESPKLKSDKAKP
ncbi:MAG: integrase, partial [Amylibacter sp.]